MAIKGFHHVALKVPDLEKAIQFYFELLGFTIHARWDGCVMLDAGHNNILEVFANGEMAQEHNEGYVHLAYYVEKADDVDQYVYRARSLGYAVTIEAKDVNLTPDYPARIAFIKGPAGELIEFFFDPQMAK